MPRSSPRSSEGPGLAAVAELRARVFATNACDAIPGCTIKIDNFLPRMWSAVAKGFILPAEGEQLQEGLLRGFKLGVDPGRMSGHRFFSNYPSATTTGRTSVAAAVTRRVKAGKTLALGPMSDGLAHAIRSTFAASCIFPLGAAAKALLPGQTSDQLEWRPTSDHTRTGLNAATDMTGLRFALNALDEISWFFSTDTFMRVSDVADAFLNLPLHPDVWPFFFSRFFGAPDSDVEHLYLHTCADFGAAGTPGTFHLFYVRGVVQMARAEQVLTLPMAVYVDDNCLMGSCRERVDAEMESFQAWALDVVGLVFKVAKDRVAAQQQLALGFVWDSTTLTRTIEERKLQSYLALLLEYANLNTLGLAQMQSMAGKLHRMILTLPPGARCLATSLFELMSGLRLPWHRRRTTRRLRADFMLVHALLSANLGRGHYSYAHFRPAPSVWTDASKQARYTGGGWVSACGAFDYFKYGSRAARQPIDFLEGDTVVACVERLAHKWRGCVVQFFIDNSAFMQSGAKGRSRAHRLNDLLRELFGLMIKFGFVIAWTWIATEDNVNADHLSRGRISEFFQAVYKTGAWTKATLPDPMPDLGRTRTLPDGRGALARGLAGEGRAAAAAAEGRVDTNFGEEPADAAADFGGAVSPGVTLTELLARASAERPGDGGRPDGLPKPMPAAAAMRGGWSTRLVLLVFSLCVVGGDCMPLSAQQASLSYSRASIYDGLPGPLTDMMYGVMDNRLSSSSWRTVSAGVAIWGVVCAAYGWERVIRTDDPQRGGKLAAFVLYMTTKTTLSWGSIEQYVWGLRVWMQSQMVVDPLMGVLFWSPFMQAVKVLTWVPCEPRRAVPHTIVEAIIDMVEARYLHDFFAVQMVFLILVLYYSFSRTECPCPKSYSGRECYDKDVHWNVQDFDIHATAGVPAMWVRFRAIKQDPRQERPAARTSTGDWACLGDVPGSKWSLIRWYSRLQQLHGVARDPRSPMFLDKDRARSLLYRVARTCFIDLQSAVGVAEGEHAGLHGLRVAGYNRAKAGLGADMAQAHGGWASRAHERYARFPLADVVRIPAVIAGVDAGARTPPAPTNEAEERVAGPPDRRLQRDHVREAAGAEGGAPTAAPAATQVAVEDDGEEGGEGGTDGEDEVVLPYRGGGAGPRPGASPEPVRYWFQAGYQPPARPPPTPRPPTGAPRAQSPPSRRSNASPAHAASPASGSASGGD